MRESVSLLRARCADWRGNAVAPTSRVPDRKPRKNDRCGLRLSLMTRGGALPPSCVREKPGGCPMRCWSRLPILLSAVAVVLPVLALSWWERREAGAVRVQMQREEELDRQLGTIV